MRRPSRIFIETAGKFVLSMSAYKVKVLSAIVAAALGAAVGMVLPDPRVEAGIGPAIEADVLDYRPLGRDCAQQAWPYYAQNCRRYSTQSSGEE